MNKNTSKASHLIHALTNLLEAIQQAGANTTPSISPSETQKAGETTSSVPSSSSSSHQAGENTSPAKS